MGKRGQWRRKMDASGLNLWLKKYKFFQTPAIPYRLEKMEPWEALVYNLVFYAALLMFWQLLATDKRFGRQSVPTPVEIFTLGLPSLFLAKAENVLNTIRNGVYDSVWEHILESTFRIHISGIPGCIVGVATGAWMASSNRFRAVFGQVSFWYISTPGLLLIMLAIFFWPVEDRNMNWTPYFFGFIAAVMYAGRITMAALLDEHNEELKNCIEHAHTSGAKLKKLLWMGVLIKKTEVAEAIKLGFRASIIGVYSSEFLLANRGLGKLFQEATTYLVLPTEAMAVFLIMTGITFGSMVLIRLALIKVR